VASVRVAAPLEAVRVMAMVIAAMDPGRAAVVVTKESGSRY
jgi:hypothetical protein